MKAKYNLFPSIWKEDILFILHLFYPKYPPQLKLTTADHLTSQPRVNHFTTFTEGDKHFLDAFAFSQQCREMLFHCFVLWLFLMNTCKGYVLFSLKKGTLSNFNNKSIYNNHLVITLSHMEISIVPNSQNCMYLKAKNLNSSASIISHLGNELGWRIHLPIISWSK